MRILDHFALFLSLSLSRERFLTELANELLGSTSSAKAPRANGSYSKAYG